MGVENVYPYSAPDAEQMKEYLDNPPAGMYNKISRNFI